MTIAEANNPLAPGIVNIIKEKGLKQIYVAEKAGFMPNEMCDMLNGRKLIKACDILKLAQAFGVTANDIYEAGEEEVR